MHFHLVHIYRYHHRYYHHRRYHHHHRHPIITELPPTTIIIIVIVINGEGQLSNTPTMTSYLLVMSLVRYDQANGFQLRVSLFVKGDKTQPKQHKYYFVLTHIFFL